jgi:hypothetical protein
MTLTGISTHSRVQTRPVADRVQSNAPVQNRVQPNQPVENRVLHNGVADRVMPNSIVTRSLNIAA